MHPFRSSVVVLAVLTIGLLSGGLAPASAAQDAPEEKVLRIEWNSYPETLDPQVVSNAAQYSIVALGFEGLTRIDEELNTVPAAAESWQFSDDAMTLTFHLREGLVYSDGTPLTAERFRYTIERVCDPRVDSVWASTFFDIAGCAAFFTSLDVGEGTPADAASPAAYEAARANLGARALDDRTLEISFTKPAVYFPTAASMQVFFPAKQELIEAGGAEWWRDPANLVGNGPFVIAALPPEGGNPTTIAFTANERYWNGRPVLDRIEYRNYADMRPPEERMNQYRRGDLDMVWLDYSSQAAVEADPVLAPDLLLMPYAGTGHLGFNTHREPFQDKKVREAFAYGFDREAYCQTIEYGFCQPTLSWIPPGVPGAIETDAFAFDPQKARRALAESSYGGPEGLPEVTWYYSTEPSEGLTSMQAAEFAADQYRAVLGIELNLVALEDDEWDPLFEVADPALRPQLFERGWYQDYPDPQDWLSVYWTCDSAWNLEEVAYCNPELDALLARADAELDPEARLALYEEASRMLVADVPSVFLSNGVQLQLVKPYVTGYAVTVMDQWPGWMTPLTIDVERPG